MAHLDKYIDSIANQQVRYRTFRRIHQLLVEHPLMMECAEPISSGMCHVWWTVPNMGPGYSININQAGMLVVHAGEEHFDMTPKQYGYENTLNAAITKLLTAVRAAYPRVA